MGVDLDGAGGTFRASNHLWRCILRLAHESGWEPAGTLKPSRWGAEFDGMAHPGGAWDGMNYFTNDYQVVTAEDAAQLAAVLERTLPDVPTHAIGRTGWDYDVGPLSDLLEYLSGPENATYLRAFIAFCRKGSFTIG